MVPGVNRNSIGYNFVKNISIILSLSTFALSVILAINEWSILTHTLETKGRSFASYIAQLSQDPLVMKDSIQLDSIVNVANKDEDIMYAIIRDAKGKLVTSQYASINYQSPRLTEILSQIPKDAELEEITAAIRNKEAIMELSVPIFTGTDKVGQVTICMSKNNIWKQISKTVIFVIVLNVFVAIVLGIMVFIVSRKTIFNPVTKLAQVIDRLAQGDLSARITIKATGELQKLLDDFNQMAESLNKTTVSKDYVNNIIESMFNLLIVVSPEDKILTINKATCELLGYEENELIGMPIEEIFGSGKTDKTLQVNTVSAYSQSRNIEDIYRKKDGTEIPVLLSTSAMYNRNEVMQGLVVVAQDITERKLAEEEIKKYSTKLEAMVKDRTIELENVLDNLQNTQQQLLQSEKMASIGQLAAGVAHEINNPIGFVLSNLSSLSKYIDKFSDFIKAQSDVLYENCTQEQLAELDKKKTVLKIEYLTQDVNDLISESLEGINRVKKIVQDLKSFSHVDEMKYEYADINECMESTINIIWNELKYKATVKKDYGNIPRLKCYAGQLSQVFMNILVNAVHSIETKGEITIKTSAQEGSVHVAISDTGCGIPPDKISKIFEPFYTSKEVGKGTGLGLSIAYNVIKKHNGEITINSEVGKGTTFVISIPVAE